MSDAKCGTYAGYMRHVNAGDLETCDDCRAARNAYMREYRASRPVVYDRQKQRQRTRDRAMRILAERHQAELNTIISALNRGELS